MSALRTGLCRPGIILYLALVIFAAQTTHSAPVYESDSTQVAEYDGTGGCYYNFQHYQEGARIITNEPCLNCTCHNRMLMCYLRVCPFSKAIGQDCTVEKRPDQCCPVITCPEVPVQLLTSTTISPSKSSLLSHQNGTSAMSSTELGFPDTYGCNVNDRFFADGAQLPIDSNNPCELCYCIRNKTTCLMQQCTLTVAGCKPIYQPGICCPVKYNCEYDEESSIGTTPGLIMTTTFAPRTTSPQCHYEDKVYEDGELIYTIQPCQHCYCFHGEIVCAVQECGKPMESHGKNCTALPPLDGECCPTTYQCDDEFENLATEIPEAQDKKDISQENLDEETKKQQESFPGADNAIPEEVVPLTEESQTISLIGNEVPESEPTKSPISNEENVTTIKAETEKPQPDLKQTEVEKSDTALEQTAPIEASEILTDGEKEIPETTQMPVTDSETKLSTKVKEEIGSEMLITESIVTDNQTTESKPLQIGAELTAAQEIQEVETSTIVDLSSSTTTEKMIEEIDTFSMKHNTGMTENTIIEESTTILSEMVDNSSESSSPNREITVTEQMISEGVTETIISSTESEKSFDTEQQIDQSQSTTTATALENEKDKTFNDDSILSSTDISSMNSIEENQTQKEIDEINSDNTTKMNTADEKSEEPSTDIITKLEDDLEKVSSIPESGSSEKESEIQDSVTETESVSFTEGTNKINNQFGETTPTILEISTVSELMNKDIIEDNLATTPSILTETIKEDEKEQVTVITNILESSTIITSSETEPSAETHIPVSKESTTDINTNESKTEKLDLSETSSTISAEVVTQDIKSETTEEVSKNVDESKLLTEEPAIIEKTEESIIPEQGPTGIPIYDRLPEHKAEDKDAVTDNEVTEGYLVTGSGSPHIVDSLHTEELESGPTTYLPPLGSSTESDRQPSTPFNEPLPKENEELEGYTTEVYITPNVSSEKIEIMETSEISTNENSEGHTVQSEIKPTTPISEKSDFNEMTTISVIKGENISSDLLLEPTIKTVETITMKQSTSDMEVTLKSTDELSTEKITIQPELSVDESSEKGTELKNKPEITEKPMIESEKDEIKPEFESKTESPEIENESNSEVSELVQTLNSTDTTTDDKKTLDESLTTPTSANTEKIESITEDDIAIYPNASNLEEDSNETDLTKSTENISTDEFQTSHPSLDASTTSISEVTESILDKSSPIETEIEHSESSTISEIEKAIDISHTEKIQPEVSSTTISLSDKNFEPSTSESMSSVSSLEESTELSQSTEGLSEKVEESSHSTESIIGSSQVPETEVEVITSSDITPESGIPGEGNCLVDGQSYSNNSAIPPANSCQISCRCMSSIVQCELIQCSPPPADLSNCTSVYSSTDVCCPMYTCDSTPSIELQAGNQMTDNHMPIYGEEIQTPHSEEPSQTEKVDSSLPKSETDNETISPASPIEEETMSTTLSTDISSMPSIVPSLSEKINGDEDVEDETKLGEIKPTEITDFQEVTLVNTESMHTTVKTTEDDKGEVSEQDKSMPKSDLESEKHTESPESIYHKEESFITTTDESSNLGYSTDTDKTDLLIESSKPTMAPETTVPIVVFTENETKKISSETFTSSIMDEIATSSTESLDSTTLIVEDKTEEKESLPKDIQMEEESSSSTEINTIKIDESSTLSSEVTSQEQEYTEPTIQSSKSTPGLEEFEHELTTVITPDMQPTSSSKMEESVTTSNESVKSEETITKISEDEKVTSPEPSTIMSEASLEGNVSVTVSDNKIDEESSSNLNEISENTTTKQIVDDSIQTSSPVGEEEASKSPSLQDPETEKGESESSSTKHPSDKNIKDYESVNEIITEETPVEAKPEEKATFETFTEISSANTDKVKDESTDFPETISEVHDKITEQPTTSSISEINQSNTMIVPTEKTIESDSNSMKSVDEQTTEAIIENKLPEIETPKESNENKETIDTSTTTPTKSKESSTSVVSIPEKSEEVEVSVEVSTEVSTMSSAGSEQTEPIITTNDDEEISSHETFTTIESTKVESYPEEKITEAPTEASDKKLILSEESPSSETPLNNEEKGPSTQENVINEKSEETEPSTVSIISEEAMPEISMTTEVHAMLPHDLVEQNTKGTVSQGEPTGVETSEVTGGDEDQYQVYQQTEESIPPIEEDHKPIDTSATSLRPEPSKPFTRPEYPDQEKPETDDDTIFPPDGADIKNPFETDESDTEDYDDQAVYGPGTCRYGGKIYMSAQQIPRDDPCDFCFCFRSDIICLQQSCPPPIPGCHEEPINGFCCPRYECPVSMATSLNVTTTTTTTTTTVPPHFLSHAYKGNASRGGCQIGNKAYRVGEDIKSKSGPCMGCTCGGDGKMKCEPKACSASPMLKEMIAHAAARKRRR